MAPLPLAMTRVLSTTVNETTEGKEHPESLGQSICRSRLDASGKIRGLRPS
ncbi:Uncharacterised protein [Mycobacteroides abscessus subsp. abscessus]|nr:Uncharacterised protein [Mycobacteroides abscessus subsp. abscessus]